MAATKRISGKPKLVERDIAKLVSDFMEYRGWRRYRNNVGMALGMQGNMVSFGERGSPDLRFVKYFKEPYGAAVTLWIETKRPGYSDSCSCVIGTPKKCRNCQQSKWRKEERLRGGIVWVISDFDEFLGLYESKFSYLHTGSMPGQGRLF